VSPFVAVILGYLVAMVTLSQVLRWMALLMVTISPHGGDFLGPPKRRLALATPLILFLHPITYAIVAIVVATIAAALGRLPATWTWTIVGFYLYAIPVGAITLKVMRRARRVD
jgi:hypothetical protein